MTAKTTRRGAGLLLLLALNPSCSSRSSAGYQRVWIEASELTLNGTPPEAEGHCLTLPLLLGSRVERTFESDTSLDISAEATRDDFTVIVQGRDSVSSSHSVEELNDDFSEDFQVVADNGVTYTIRLRPGC